MKKYVEQTWSWQEDYQKQYFSDKFAPDNLQIILRNGESIGVIEVYDKEKELFIADLKIVPEFQNKGIGTTVIEEIIARSIEDKKPIVLQVLKVNPAKQLYKRLGFKVTADTKTHLIMKRNPTSLRE